MKKLIVFDLDGTLAESKSSLDAEMSRLLGDLLGIVKAAVISGGDWPQFEKQVLSHLPHDANLANLSILPTCGTKFFRYAGDWKKIYSEDFTANEKEKIVSSLKKAVEEAGFQAKKVWGEAIEDRGSQITFSALGQQAPLEEKKKWDPDFAKRKKIKAILDTLIPEFSVRMGGATSVDVTKPGIDKAYGIGKLRDVLGHFIEGNDLHWRCFVPGRERLSGGRGGGRFDSGSRSPRDEAGYRNNHRLSVGSRSGSVETVRKVR